MQTNTKKLLGVNKSLPFIYYAPAICWGILIIYFSLLPGDSVPNFLKSIWDFILHFGIYFLLTLLFILGSTQFQFKKSSITIFIIAVFITSLMGGCLELVQQYVIENRHGDWFDFFANNSGALAASFSWFLLAKK